MSSKTLPPKESWQELQNRFSPFPTIKPCPLTSDPWPHCVLYWLGTNWWGLGFVCASLPCASKICLLLMRLPRLVCIVCCLFLIIFWFLFPLWLALFRAGPCLMVVLLFLQPTLLPAIISYNTTPSFLLQSCFASNWVGLFGLAVYSSLNGLTRPLVLMLHC